MNPQQQFQEQLKKSAKKNEEIHAEKIEASKPRWKRVLGKIKKAVALK